MTLGMSYICLCGGTWEFYFYYANLFYILKPDGKMVAS